VEEQHVLTVEFERLNLQSGLRVLDLACGEGRHARGMHRLPGVAAVALDIGEKEVSSAAASLRTMDGDNPPPGGAGDEAGPWLVVRGDCYHLPFPNEAFDCVVASEILEHLHDDDRALAEIGRVLKPGGNLAVSVPRWGPEAVCWALSREYRRTPGGHVRIYRRRQLRSKLVAHGFEITGRHFAHGLHSPYWWLKCVVGLDQGQQGLVGLYHQILMWDMLKKPPLTQRIERVLNPLIGKSEVFYAYKPALAALSGQ
jgi:SAM-dependent methyltransferase